MLGTEQTNSKSMEVVIIYPCRVVPFDKVAAEEIPYGKTIRVETSVGKELIGMKRAVAADDFDPDEHPFPANKIRSAKKDEGDKTTSEKPVEKMNKEELLALSKKEGVEVPEGATKAQIIELLQ